ncbi:MAG: bifunctional diguanylate cyclase/phosphodiesterase [Herminiimonas sp.]|nr:bifunctional diguanylate cyclase/phosphodiesterase [Herminiimonas sp.]
MLQSSYNYSLVAVSLLIASLASYTALDFAGRISSIGKDPSRIYWLLGGTCAMGLGIWSMHFVGMLAFSLPIVLGYDLAITAYSLLIALLSSYFALSVMARDAASWPRLICSGTALGVGIASMHYTGMAAMRMSPSIEYTPSVFLLSLAIAVSASIAALRISSTLRSRPYKLMWLPRMAAAVVMGLAITGMHYTGMEAANFPIGSICGAASGIDAHWLAVTVIVATMSILVIALVLSVVDARMEAHTGAFNRSLRIANERLQYQATHDALTGLPNRMLLSERIQHAIAAAERTNNRFAVYFIDLDGFKAINDTLGHTVGDALLKELADRLKATVRKEDIVARLGGDEFVIMVENIPDISMAAHIAEKLFNCFKAEFNLMGAGAGSGGMGISPSIGISLYPDNGATMEVLLRHADAAMYEVKASGRNNYLFFESSMNVASMRTIEIQRSMRTAIKDRQFFIHYQPKFDCNGLVSGAEALLRWQHPRLGLISPAEFITIAERSGQIIEIGYWVIEEVCKQLNEWAASGQETVKVAVNLSQIQLRAPNLVEEVLALTTRFGIAPSMMMFEITESVAMQNAEETMKTVAKLQGAGFDLAIDDFGTGYSSLSYLQQFAVRQLKVDRTFVNRLSESDPKALSVVAAIINLAHSLNMEVVAEGVETQSQHAILKGMQCDQVQGYLMAKPLSNEEFSKLMRRQGRCAFDFGGSKISAGEPVTASAH